MKTIKLNNTLKPIKFDSWELNGRLKNLHFEYQMMLKLKTRQ